MHAYEQKRSTPPANSTPRIAPVRGLFQRKAAQGGSGGAAEQEAERVAARIAGGATLDRPIQRHAGQAAQPGSDLPTSVKQVLSSAGAPLQTDVRGDMEQRFGYDFSRVRVHTDSLAERSARDANAHAYTFGHHIVFGAGQFAPGSQEGHGLLAHELTHVAQQESGVDGIACLIRSPYPWQGVVTGTGVHVRSSASAADATNIIGSLSKPQKVTVKAASGDWLQIETKVGATTLTGYIHNSFVDDATSAAMASSVGTTMVWKPSRPGSGTDFEKWASAATEAPFPVVTAATVMNCWEAVLLAAYRAGALNWSWLHTLYAATPTVDWPAKMTRGARTKYAIPGPSPRPKRGDLVFFNGLAHVALATGNGSEVYTFWPPPNTPFTAGGTTDKVKVFTIEALVSWWAANLPPAPVVEFGAPAW